MSKINITKAPVLRELSLFEAVVVRFELLWSSSYLTERASNNHTAPADTRITIIIIIIIIKVMSTKISNRKTNEHILLWISMLAVNNY